MAAKAPAGPQRVTRAHPVLFSEEEDTVDAVNAGEMELGTAAYEEAILDSFPQAVNVQDVDTEPVV